MWTQHDVKAKTLSVMLYNGLMLSLKAYLALLGSSDHRKGLQVRRSQLVRCDFGA